MSAKKTTGNSYKCSSCGHIQLRWMGRCPECGEWNSFVEYIQQSETAIPGIGSRTTERQKPQPLSKVNPMEGSRLTTGNWRRARNRKINPTLTNFNFCGSEKPHYSIICFRGRICCSNTRTRRQA